MNQIAIIRPLRERDFRLLWIGQTTSLLGDGVFLVALAWQVYSLSSQPAAFSAVLMARSVPMLLLLLIGGVVTDRVDRRTVMLISDIVRGLCVAGMAALAGIGALELWHLVVLSAVFGAADAFFFPAYTSIIPDILSAELLLQANALESATRPLAIRFAGPALGGLLVGRLGTAPAFWLDAVTFAVSAVSLWLMTARPVPQGRRSGLLGEIVEGYRYARAEAWIWVTLVAAAFAVLFAVGPFEVLMPLIARDRLRAGAEGFGAIIAASGPAASSQP